MEDECDLCNCSRGGGLHMDDCLVSFYRREKSVYEGWCRDKDNYPDNFNHFIEDALMRGRQPFVVPEANQIYYFDSLVQEYTFQCYKRYKQSKMDMILAEERIVFLEDQYDTLKDHFIDWHANPLNG